MDPEIEEELYRFGPMGVSISFARPGIFVWSRQNNTEVVLTSRRIYGQGKMPAFASMFGKAGTPVFDVPLQEIIAIEPVDFLMNKAVWIRYRTRPGKKRLRSSGLSSVTVISPASWNWSVGWCRKCNLFHLPDHSSVAPFHPGRGSWWRGYGAQYPLYLPTERGYWLSLFLRF